MTILGVGQYDALIVALIVAIIGPILLSLLTGRQRRQEKKEDYARQDSLANEAAKMGEIVRESQKAAGERAEEVATLLINQNLLSEKRNKTQNNKLNQIHTLVNSNMTRVMENELDARKVYLIALEEVLELKQAAGVVPTPEMLKTIEDTKNKILELTFLLNERYKIQLKMEEEGKE